MLCSQAAPGQWEEEQAAEWVEKSWAESWPGGHPLLWSQQGRVPSSSRVLQERRSSWRGSEPQNRMNPFVCGFENYEVSFDKPMLTLV